MPYCRWCGQWIERGVACTAGHAYRWAVERRIAARAAGAIRYCADRIAIPRVWKEYADLDAIDILRRAERYDVRCGVYGALELRWWSSQSEPRPEIDRGQARRVARAAQRYAADLCGAGLIPRCGRAKKKCIDSGCLAETE